MFRWARKSNCGSFKIVVFGVKMGVLGEISAKERAGSQAGSPGFYIKTLLQIFLKHFYCFFLFKKPKVLIVNSAIVVGSGITS